MSSIHFFKPLSIMSIWCYFPIDTKPFGDCNSLIMSRVQVGAEERIRLSAST